jgi:alkylation response protein AidB-like acyl-CoA dehydrogenase
VVQLVPDDELTAVAELARRLGLEKLSPVARSAEESGRIDDGTWQALLDSGLTVIVRPEHGGDGVLDAVTQVVAAENLGHGDPGIALGALWSGAAATLVSEHGTARHAEYARRLTSDASARGSLALYESFGRGPDEWTTTIAQEDGRVRVRGTKVGVPFADEAAAIVVVGRDPATGTLRAALVPRDAAGVTPEPVYGSLALEAAPTREVRFDVKLPADALLGRCDPLALGVDVERIRLLVGAVAVGTGRRAIEYASEYATQREAFGRAIAGFQGVSFMLAEKHMRIEAARLEVAEAAAGIDAGVSTVEELAALRTAVRDAVNYATDAAAMTTRDAVQALGGHGFIADHPVELWYRSAAALAVLDFDPLVLPFSPVL